MIDRDYLPYESARRYVDRGMAKWMGFFLSEHGSALAKTQGADGDYSYTETAPAQNLGTESEGP